MAQRIGRLCIRPRGLSLFIMMSALMASVPSRALSPDAPINVQCRTAFDSEYFYVAAEVQKETLRGSVSAPFQDPYKDDCFAVYLAAPSGQRVEMVVSVAQGAQLYRGAERTGLRGVEDFLPNPDGGRWLFKYRLRAKGELNGSANPNNGFTVELAIPWAELGGPPRPGAIWQFNVAVVEPGEGSSRIASFSPTAKTREDLTQVERWGHIVFTDAPVASIAAAPGAAVCARVYNVKPVIDGAIAEGEWSRVTAFTFSSSEAPRTFGLGTAAAARRREPIELRPAPPIGRIVARASVTRPRSLSRQQWPRLVFARYRVDYQADARKPLPLRAVAASNGQTLLASHPMDGTGPWLTYDRVDWHRIQLSRMREAGVDVAAVTYRPSREGRLALTAMSAALRAMDTLGMAHPMVCLWLDASGLPGQADVPSVLHQAIRTFRQCVASNFVLRVPLLGNNGPGTAAVVVVAGLSPSALDAAIPLVHAAIARSHEEPVLLVAAGAGSEAADAVVPDASASGYEMAQSPAVRIASLFAGAPGRHSDEHPLARRTISAYREAWRKAVVAQPDWVFIESWNDHFAGSEIVPTVEYGLQYLDITRAFASAFTSKGSVGGSLISHNLPATAPASATYSVRLVLRNDGTTVWSGDETEIGAGWDGATPVSVGSLRANVAPGEWAAVPVRIPIPSAAGDHQLGFFLLRKTRRGDRRSAGGSAATELGYVAARVVPASDALPAATLTDASMPRGLENQSAYRIAVTVRNDGAAPWPAGQTAIVARLLQADAEAEPAVADMADAHVTLGESVPPGAEVTVAIPVTAARADGTPFRFSDEAGQRYLLRFDVDMAGDVPTVLPTQPQEVEILETDAGVVFYNDYTPARLPAQRRVPVPIGVRNRGPQTWLKDRVAVGYHWYFLDGTEAVWEDEVFPIRTDVPPGAEIGDVGAWVTAPPYDGTYWLVWDLRVGDTWVSTLPAVRAYETRVSLVQVVEGKLHFVDLRSVADVRAAASAEGGGTAFDDQGKSFPVELTPPYSINVPTCATLWLPEVRTGTNRSRQISFRWLSSAGPSAVTCKGQEITVGTRKDAPVGRRVHLLLAATKPGESMAVTMHFANGSEQYSSFPVAAWDAPPSEGQVVAHAMPYSRSAADGAPGPPVFVHWYTVQVKERLPLTAIVLGNAPSVRVVAITVEE